MVFEDFFRKEGGLVYIVPKVYPSQCLDNGSCWLISCMFNGSLLGSFLLLWNFKYLQITWFTYLSWVFVIWKHLVLSMCLFFTLHVSRTLQQKLKVRKLTFKKGAHTSTPDLRATKWRHLQHLPSGSLSLYSQPHTSLVYLLPNYY